MLLNITEKVPYTVYSEIPRWDAHYKILPGSYESTIDGDLNYFTVKAEVIDNSTPSLFGGVPIGKDTTGDVEGTITELDITISKVPRHVGVEMTHADVKPTDKIVLSDVKFFLPYKEAEKDTSTFLRLAKLNKLLSKKQIGMVTTGIGSALIVATFTGIESAINTFFIEELQLHGGTGHFIRNTIHVLGETAVDE